MTLLSVGCGSTYVLTGRVIRGTAGFSSFVQPDQLADGKPVSEVSPFWRMITSQDKMAKKLNVDPAWIDEQRALEAG